MQYFRWRFSRVFNYCFIQAKTGNKLDENWIKLNLRTIRARRFDIYIKIIIVYFGFKKIKPEHTEIIILYLLRQKPFLRFGYILSKGNSKGPLKKDIYVNMDLKIW